MNMAWWFGKIIISYIYSEMTQNKKIKKTLFFKLNCFSVTNNNTVKQLNAENK